MITLTYAVTCYKELEEITKLLNFLQQNIRPEDEILVQYDTDSVTPEVLEYLKILDGIHDNHTIIGFPLNGDFATFKNNQFTYSTKDYVFNIDADELPHQNLIDNLPAVLEKNPVDMVFVPRISTVDGITDEHVEFWKWKVNDKNWINFPDYQTRVFKRTDDIKWMGKVHERITGYSTFANFPADEEWCLYHHKTIENQEAQNKFYETL